jgi:DNA-binding transcriptional LysR family regulator
MQTTIYAMNIFVRAVEHNSFVGAARSMFIDPAVVSRTISALEKELGVVLFARSTRALDLTLEGKRFYGDCLQILQKFTDATQRFRAGRAIPVGLLKIGMAPGLRRRILLRAIPSFQRDYQQVDLVLISTDDRAELAHKGIDVLIRARSVRHEGGSRPEPQGLVVRKLFQSRYVVCAAPEYLKRAGVPRTPAELRQHAYVAHVSLDHDVAHEWRFVKPNARETVKLVPNLRIQGVDGLCEAGVAGCGIVRFLAANIDDELQSGALVPVLSDWECTGSPPMLAVYRKTKPMIPQVSSFIGYLMEAFRRYNYRPGVAV